MSNRRRDRREAKERRYRQAKRPIDKRIYGFAGANAGMPFYIDDVSGAGNWFWEATYPCTVTGIRWTGQFTCSRGTQDPLTGNAPNHALMIFWIQKQGMDGQLEWDEDVDGPAFYSEQGFPSAENIIGWQSLYYPGSMTTKAGAGFYWQNNLACSFDGETCKAYETDRYSKAQRKMMVGDKLCWRGIMPTDGGLGAGDNSISNVFWEGAVQIFIKS